MTSYGEIANELGMDYLSKEVINSVDKIRQISKNAKSEEQAKQLISQYLRDERKRIMKEGQNHE